MRLNLNFSPSSRALCLVTMLTACTVDKNLTTDPTDSTGTEGTTVAATEATDGTTGPGDGTTETTLASEPTSSTDPTNASQVTMASEPTSSTDPDSTTEPEGATGTTAGDTDTAGDADFVEMEKCRLPAVCEPFSHLIADGEPYHPNQEPILPGEQCVWEGLRDGTPGRYRYTTDHEFGNGHEDREHLIHVHADRKVTFAVAFDLTLDEEPPEQGFEPAKTCTLAAPAFFDNCVVESADFDVHFTCAFTDMWWTDCVEDGPMCE